MPDHRDATRPVVEFTLTVRFRDSTFDPEYAERFAESCREWLAQQVDDVERGPLKKVAMPQPDPVTRPPGGAI